MVTKPYPVEYEVRNSTSSMAVEATQGSMSYSSLILRACAHVSELYMREFSKSLTDRAYTWYVNLRASSVHDWEHLVSLYNVKFFYVEAKFSLSELS